jgi:hypothetical protein
MREKFVAEADFALIQIGFPKSLRRFGDWRGILGDGSPRRRLPEWKSDFGKIQLTTITETT